MNETTFRGNIITDPSSRRVGDDPVFSFRVASNSRYQDRDTGEWKNGSTLYFTATCWGRLAERASGKLFKGDAVIVSGRLQTNEYEREGVVRRDLEMRVTGLGPDMSRMDVTARRARPDEAPMPPEPAPDGEGGVDEAINAVGSVDAGDPVDAGEPADGDAGADSVTGRAGALAGAARS